MNEQREKPILFSAPMVRAILEGRKTQTRRVVKASPIASGVGWNVWWSDKMEAQVQDAAFIRLHCPFGVPGDRLWVRETLQRPDGDPWLYTADRQPVMVAWEDETPMLVWAHHKEQDYCPSIHMPRWASRITLEITDVRVQRVQEISEEDARSEGCEPPPLETCGVPGEWAKVNFELLWDHINEKRGFGWAANPWVWCVGFQRVPQQDQRASRQDGVQATT
jgi:hypothetical protein